MLILVGSEIDRAVNVTVELGTFPGAVYVVATPVSVAAGETDPQPPAEHPKPERVQVTPLSAVSLVSVAVNCAVARVATVALAGLTDRVIAGELSVMVAVADWLESVTDAAVIVTVLGVGGVAGAV
jgi:hypothetical protein